LQELYVTHKYTSWRKFRFIRVKSAGTYTKYQGSNF